ncbi:MAG: thiamine phosphate synthase [Candidatus Diapherotrites archaeon]|uniref:Thiamine-phosphate synthase n=1 Tax=Candidatus Iainarchaeum sp. TaxID=3101447 RepID=A0A8T4L9U0_9ARCH|nr:thiamine phosphate synthase [Candidatus Diapherotrites archaeon]
MGPEFLCFWDANLNRAREGLRVIEDFARFVLKEEKATLVLKQLRHQLTRVASRVCFERRALLARASAVDVGAQSYLVSEGSRHAWDELLEANFNRVGEALRCLEEAAKLRSAPTGRQLKRLRFRVYSVEEKLAAGFLRFERMQKFGRASLYVVLDARQFRKDLDYAEACRLSLAGGAEIIQLRDKRLKGKKLLALAKALARQCRKKNALFLVNDRADVAKAVDADGVHLGQGDLPVSVARALLGFDKIIGKSTHSLRQAQKAVAEGADYLSVGPVFETPSKPGVKAVGLGLVSRVRKRLKIPFVAVGGIDGSNVNRVVASGASLVAVIRAVVSAPKPKTAAKRLHMLVCARKNGKANRCHVSGAG